MPRYLATITVLCWDTVDRMTHHISIEYGTNASCIEEAETDCREQFDGIIELSIKEL